MTSKPVFYPMTAGAGTAIGSKNSAGAASATVLDIACARTLKVTLDSAVPAQKRSQRQRQKLIVKDEPETACRRGYTDRIATLRAAHEALIGDIEAHARLLELESMQRDGAPFSNWQASQDALEWAKDARRTLELGLMQVERSLAFQAGMKGTDRA